MGFIAGALASGMIIAFAAHSFIFSRINKMKEDELFMVVSDKVVVWI